MKNKKYCFFGKFFITIFYKKGNQINQLNSTNLFNFFNSVVLKVRIFISTNFN
jgi:hypothetical protein